MSNARTPGPTAPPELREQVRALIESIGDGAVAKRSGVSRPALARVVAGLPVRNGTIVLARNMFSTSEAK
jgi:hypothetical protein